MRTNISLIAHISKENKDFELFFFDSLMSHLYYARAMQKVKLPHLLDPIKSAIKKSDYVGVFVAKDLSRLTQSVDSIDGDVDVTLSFDKDEQGLVIVCGKASCMVSLTCQRCNQKYVQQLASEFVYSPVRSEEQRLNLPEGYEPLELDEYGEFNLLQLIEDELILATPIVPKHAQEECSVVTDSLSWGEIDEAEEHPNPFAVLKGLKK